MAIYTSSGVKIAETSGNDIVLPDPGEVQELRRIADIAAKNAEFAKKQAESAKREARFSKAVSIISLIIGLISLFAPFFASTPR